jgi:uncharacterized membrane protein
MPEDSDRASPSTDPAGRSNQIQQPQIQPPPLPQQTQPNPPNMNAPFGVPPIQATIIAHQQQLWHGPYPPPDAVERYEKVLPGTFDRFIRMAEELQRAQIDQSASALNAQIRAASRGHWLGFAATALALAGAVLCVIYDQPYVALAFLSVPVMAVARALINSARSSSTSGPPTS